MERVEESLSPATGKRSLHFGRDDTLGNKYTLSGRKFIKIQDGCNQGCSFCITQFVRGKPTSASPEKVIKEINFWANRGIKEIILTGINIGLYGIDNENSPLSFRANKESRGIPSKQKRRDPPTEPALSKAEEVGMTITNLVNQILKQTKIERISFSSIYPEMLISMTGSNPVSKFTEIVVNNSRISQYFHLSLQSGSQTVLERMNRKTNLDQLLKKLQWIKSKNPLFTFRADIIAGFPNETEKEFQETLDFMVNARISSAHVFTYSPRKGTVAFEMIKSKKWQDLSESVKKERAEKIRTVVEKTRGKEAKRLITKVFNCLIVKRTPNGYEGITENGWPIRISIKKPSFAKATAGKQVLCIKGKILPVKITGYKKDQLLGEIVDLPTKGTKTSGIPTLPSGC